MVVDNGNNGGVAATGVVANATVPAGMTFVSATPSVGTCSFVAPNVVCPLGNILGSLNTGVAATIDIQMRPSIPGGGTVTSTASVTSTNDTNVSNNSVPQTTTIIAGADLVLAVAASPSPVNGSGIISYTLSPTNNGPDGTTKARLSLIHI